MTKPSQEIDENYSFEFLTDEEAKSTVEGAFWYKVGDILEMKSPAEINTFLIENELLSLPKATAKFANETLYKLYQLVHNTECINFYLEKDESLEKVLNIFIRVNSGGTQLSYSDLLLSIATAQWKNKDAREEITSFVDDLNRTGDGFEFNKDFVLKCSLVLSEFSDIAFKVDNFNKKNMDTIEANWDPITDAIRLAINLTASFGYSRETLTSNRVLKKSALFLNSY